MPLEGSSAVTCQACRARHAKCDAFLPACQHCRSKGIRCIRGRNIRFRNGIEAHGDSGSVFAREQPWQSLNGPLKFYDETPDLTKYYSDLLFEQSALPGTVIDSGLCIMDSKASKKPLYLASEQPCKRVARATVPSSIDSTAALHHETDPDQRNFLEQSSRLNDVSKTTRLPTVSAIQFDAANASVESPTSSRSQPSSLLSPMHRQLHIDPFSDREADLMRNFTDNMALWADVADIQRHFEIEVPRRALDNTMLRNAIFAFSARHLNRNETSHGVTEALEYHSRALHQLIPQLSGPEEGLTEDVFAAIVILRLDEEMDVDDNRFHLTGATRILNGISSFGSSGGLGEAAAWLCLRQDIYISIISQTPLKTKLDSFSQSKILSQDDDMSWANKMVLLLAKCLSLSYVEKTPERETALQGLVIEVNAWQNMKPASFEPIKFVPRGEEKGRRLPLMWMLSPFHVLGVQYYHIAKIVLFFSCSSIESTDRNSLQGFQQGRKTEKRIREHLLTILGIATSNPRVQNTLFTAKHTLVAWGGVLRNHLDQEAAIGFLKSKEMITGWDMTKVRENLQQVWLDMRDSD